MSTDQEIQKRIEQLQARQRKLKAEKAVRLRKAEARAKIILGGQLLAWLQRQAELVTRLGEERDEAAKKKAVDAFNIRYKSLVGPGLKDWPEDDARQWLREALPMVQIGPGLPPAKRGRPPKKAADTGQEGPQ